MTAARRPAGEDLAITLPSGADTNDSPAKIEPLLAPDSIAERNVVTVLKCGDTHLGRVLLHERDLHRAILLDGRRVVRWQGSELGLLRAICAGILVR